MIVALYAFALAFGATIALGAFLLALLKLRDFLDWVSTPVHAHVSVSTSIQAQQTERSAIESIIKEMETYGLD